jgi:hypothetical protein
MFVVPVTEVGDAVDTDTELGDTVHEITDVTQWAEI